MGTQVLIQQAFGCGRLHELLPDHQAVLGHCRVIQFEYKAACTHPDGVIGEPRHRGITGYFSVTESRAVVDQCLDVGSDERLKDLPSACVLLCDKVESSLPWQSEAGYQLSHLGQVVRRYDGRDKHERASLRLVGEDVRGHRVPFGMCLAWSGGQASRTVSNRVRPRKQLVNVVASKQGCSQTIGQLDLDEAAGTDTHMS